MSGVRMSARQFTGHVLVEPSGELDLAEIGLESLVRAQEHAQRTGSEVALAGLRPQALLILRLTDRISEFAVHGSVGQAVSQSAQRTGHGHGPGPDQAQEAPGLAPSMQESADAAASPWRPEKRGLGPKILAVCHKAA